MGFGYVYNIRQRLIKYNYIVIKNIKSEYNKFNIFYVLFMLQVSREYT